MGREARGGIRRTVGDKLKLLRSAERLGNVSRACQLTGFSRDSYYRLRRLFKSRGKAGLRPTSRRQPLPKRRVAPDVEDAVLNLSRQEPRWGQARVAGKVRARGVQISPTGVRGVWLRHKLTTQRLREAVERRTYANQVRRLAHVPDGWKRWARPDFKGQFPGDCGAQGVFYAGTLRRLGRIYHHLFVDTYAGVVFATVCGAETADGAVGLLRTRVLPFYAQHGVPLTRILTDPRDPWCSGKYEGYLKRRTIGHMLAGQKGRSRFSVCEGLHRALVKGFYGSALRKKRYGGRAELQRDLDAFLAQSCRSAHQTFARDRHLWRSFLGKTEAPSEAQLLVRARMSRRL